MPVCLSGDVIHACLECVATVDPIDCFGYLQGSDNCVDTVCIVCNLGLIPDGVGGCRAAGRRSDSVAYEDDLGRVFDSTGVVLWGQRKHVLHTFSYGYHWTCGIEQYSDRLYTSQDPGHVLWDGVGSPEPAFSQEGTDTRRTVSVDCRYEKPCALYYIPQTKTSAHRVLVGCEIDGYSGDTPLTDGEW